MVFQIRLDTSNAAFENLNEFADLFGQAERLIIEMREAQSPVGSYFLLWDSNGNSVGKVEVVDVR